jgi:DNA-binding MarR family transcriptional regulator
MLGRMTGMWLTADEQRTWRTYLRLNSLLLARLNRQLQQDSGLTLPEYEVLVQLSEAPRQQRRPFQICEALNWEQSRLSHQLTRMQHRGLVAREECEADGRGAFVVLTAAGANAIRSAAPGHVAAVRRLVFDRLGDDQRAAFEQACTAIIDALAELGIRAAAGGIALAVAGLAAADWATARAVPAVRGGAGLLPEVTVVLASRPGVRGRLVRARPRSLDREQVLQVPGAVPVHLGQVIGAGQLGELLQQGRPRSPGRRPLRVHEVGVVSPAGLAGRLRRRARVGSRRGCRRFVAGR